MALGIFADSQGPLPFFLSVFFSYLIGIEHNITNFVKVNLLK